MKITPYYWVFLIALNSMALGMNIEQRDTFWIAFELVLVIWCSFMLYCSVEYGEAS